MPRRDGTGPQGMGPVTGRGMGPCQGVPRYSGRGFRRARYRDFGRFNGYGYRTYQPTKEELKLEKEELEQRLNDINDALKEE